MSLARLRTRSTVTLWEAAGIDDRSRPTFLPPREVNVTWDRGISKAGGVNDENLNQVASIYSNFSIPNGSVVWFATMNKLPETGIPPSDLYEVVGVSETPNVKGRNAGYVIRLSESRVLIILRS